jgi:NTE family protein
VAAPALKRINLALQGGGAHGAVTWGVLDRLLEDDRLVIDSISGTSAGAVIAAALAFGIHEAGASGGRRKLDELWRKLSAFGQWTNPVKRSPFDRAVGDYSADGSPGYWWLEWMTRAFAPRQFNPLGLNPLRAALVECIDFAALRACDRVKLFMNATNVRTGKVKIFQIREVSVEAVLASACLPHLFDAVEIDGDHYWDGGFTGNPALFPFFYESQSQDIVLVHVNPLTRDKVPRTVAEIANRLNEISFNSVLLGELRAIGFVRKLLDDGWLKDEYRDRLKSIRMHSIRSDTALDDLTVASKYNVELDFLLELKNRGRLVADAWLAENFESLGRRSSVDIRTLYDGGA